MIQGVCLNMGYPHDRCNNENDEYPWLPDRFRGTIWLFHIALENHHAIKNGKPSISIRAKNHGYVSHNQRVPNFQTYLVETSTLSTRCLARPGLYGFELGVLNTEQVCGEIWHIGDFYNGWPSGKGGEWSDIPIANSEEVSFDNSGIFNY